MVQKYTCLTRRTLIDGLYKMDIIAISVTIAVIINSYILYKILQSYLKVKRMENSLKSREHYEWLSSMGLIETSIKFNEWGQRVEKQSKIYGLHSSTIGMWV